MQWYLKCLKNYAIFNGRARRKEYWYFFLFNNIIIPILFLGIFFLIFSLMHFNNDSNSMLNKIAVITYFGMQIYFIATIIPNLAVVVRRLHDINVSGLWCLLYLIPFGVFIIFIMTCIPSHKGENRFGLNPVEPEISPQSN